MTNDWRVGGIAPGTELLDAITYKQKDNHMQQITQFFYIVSTGEGVTIQVTPIKVNPEAILASMGGQTLPNLNPGGGVPTFAFPIVVGASGTQIALILCNFPFDTDPDAECRITVSGSGGGSFQGPVVKKSDNIHAVNLNFHVMASQDRARVMRALDRDDS